MMCLYIVFISEFDIFKEGKTIYHLEKRILETGTVVDDGLHEIFVNTAIDDKSDIAELMSCFIKTEVHNSKFPKLTEEVTKLKQTEGGQSTMSSLMEIFSAEEREKGREKERISAIGNLIKKDMSDEFILSLDYTEEEIRQAKEALLQPET